ncbi:MAG TPA: carbohydrate ABC transporter permease [Thermomicrobiales bacterium]|nr:carbohydrate ABC transporter permease [Thermomicrobiales bacterium]
MSTSMKFAAFFKPVVTYGILALGAFVMLLPFAWMLSSSLMSTQEVIARPLTWIPSALRFENYEALSDAIPLGRMYVNSIIVTTLTTLGILLTSSLAGYGFAKFQFAGRDFLFLLVLATMMIPFFVVLLPIFYMVSQLGWINTYQGLIVPNIVTGFGIFLMRQYMLSLPDEVLDAARIDGASEFEIYWRIALPLSTPVIGALGILAFVYQWNNFLWPLVVARSSDMWTVPVGLNSLRVYASSAEVINLQMAGAALAIVPVMIVFLLLQRYFVRGIALTGMKG